MTYGLCRLFRHYASLQIASGSVEPCERKCRALRAEVSSLACASIEPKRRIVQRGLRSSKASRSDWQLGSHQTIVLRALPIALAGLPCGTALKARWKPNVAGIIAADGDAAAACPSTLHRLPQLLRRRVHTAKVFQQLILPRLLIIRSG